MTILPEILASRPRPTGRPVVSEATVEQAIDPVCGMTVATVESTLHLDHVGARVWFCGSGYLRAFAADSGAWVNLRQAGERFQPLAGGMAAALPHVDVFLSGHSIAALDDVLAAIAGE